MTDTRTLILDTAAKRLGAREPVSLETVATAAGLTKPGLMYHFPTKQALMLGVVDHIADRWATDLTAALGRAPEDASPTERIAAYARHALESEFDAADLVIFGDPRLSEVLAARWTESMAIWLDIPESLPDAQRARLLAVRLLADGAWFASASRTCQATPAELALVQGLVDDLVGA